MVQVLVVEDSRLFGSVLKRRIESELGFQVHWVTTYREAEDFLLGDTTGLLLALLDLNLPDAPMGEIVEMVISRGIPSIVFTGTMTKGMRETIWSYKVIDYVLKESSYNIDYLVSLVRRIHANREIKVLVVDDSRTMRFYIADLLKVHQYQVLEAENGVDALDLLQQNPDVKLVITDFNMPKMNGFQLTEEIREKFGKGDMAIIGISAQGNNLLSARFIKNGANDFLCKPFLTEEFYCRVNQNVEMIENIARIRDSSNRDYLTGLYNRRYFFEVGDKLFANSRRGHTTTTVAMVDIDHFKKVNDTYGHDAGDLVIKAVARILASRFRESDIVARFGGEEFCVMLTDMDSGRASSIFDQLRRAIEEAETVSGGKAIRVTASIGVCTLLTDSLEEMVKCADEMLYEAKRAGRNRVILKT